MTRMLDAAARTVDTPQPHYKNCDDPWAMEFWIQQEQSDGKNTNQNWCQIAVTDHALVRKSCPQGLDDLS